MGNDNPERSEKNLKDADLTKEQFEEIMNHLATREPKAYCWKCKLWPCSQWDKIILSDHISTFFGYNRAWKEARKHFASEHMYDLVAVEMVYAPVLGRLDSLSDAS